MRKLNDWIADRLTNILSAMWLFWFMNILIWSAILLQRPHGLESWLLAIISVWFQGVALVVINRTSQRQGDRMQAVLQETHDTVMTELSEIKQIHREMGNSR